MEGGSVLGLGGGKLCWGQAIRPWDCPEQQQAAISQQENGFDYGLTSPDSPATHRATAVATVTMEMDTEEKRKAQNRGGTAGIPRTKGKAGKAARGQAQRGTGGTGSIEQGKRTAATGKHADQPVISKTTRRERCSQSCHLPEVGGQLTTRRSATS
jgi:hypothetical protein